MDCEQLNKDIANLRASRDAFQKTYDYANANLRGGIELRQSQKNILESGDELLLKYFDDLEEQNPDKWFRKFGEFEELSEFEKSIISTAGEHRKHHHDFSSSSLNEAIDECLLRNSSHDILNLNSDFSLSGVFQNDDGSFKQIGVFEALGVNDEILVVGPLDGKRPECIRAYRSVSGDEVDKHDFCDFSIKKKKYTKEPRTITWFDEKRALVGCLGGGIALIGKRNDGSWGVLEDKRWVPDSSEDPLYTIPTIWKLGPGRFGLYDLTSEATCALQMEKSLKKLKRALGFDEGDKKEP